MNLCQLQKFCQYQMRLEDDYEEIENTIEESVVTYFKLLVQRSRRGRTDAVVNQKRTGLCPNTNQPRYNFSYTTQHTLHAHPHTCYQRCFFNWGWRLPHNWRRKTIRLALLRVTNLFSKLKINGSKWKVINTT